MKNLFPGLSIICGTALLISGTTVAGVVFASLGFMGAVMGTALKHQQEQEAIKAIKELTEAIAANENVDGRIDDLAASIGEVGGAFAQLMAAFTTTAPKSWDPFGGGGDGTLQ
jgi:hypothetical protein